MSKRNVIALLAVVAMTMLPAASAQGTPVRVLRFLEGDLPVEAEITITPKEAIELVQNVEEPGVTTIACHALGCAMASSHAQKERINNAPNMYSHFTSGMGWSTQPLLGGMADIETDLGSGSCPFGPMAGCGLSWSDVASVCKAGPDGLEAKTTTTVLLPVTTIAIDPAC